MSGELEQPLASVKYTFTLPPLTPVTTPLWVTVAMAGLLLVHIPPVVGLTVVVAPIQIVSSPVMETVGSGFTVTKREAVAVQLFVPVTVTW